MGFFTGAVGIAVYQYMADADVRYLNLSFPRSETVLCLKEWPLRHSLADWLVAEEWEDWVAYRDNITAYVASRRCLGLDINNAKCSNVQVPLHDMARNLGIPLNTDGDDYSLGDDAVEVYGYAFLWTTGFMGILVILHDLALLSTRYKDTILDWRTIRNKFRCWRFLWILMGFRCWRRLARRRGLKMRNKNWFARYSHIAAYILLPVFVAWGIFSFVFIVIPVTTLVFFRYPIQFSRLLLFLNCFAAGVFGVAMSLHSLAFLIDVDKRQNYAVTWQSTDSLGTTCICGCTYPLGGGRCSALLLVGVVVAYRSFILAFRCLKGLRQANWASLMSVMFPVPLNVYEAMWTQPDGTPIQHRKVGDPVQGELAFDPFALMDEQPESSRTTLTLVPTPINPDNEPSNWSVDDVAAYLKELDLGEYCEAVYKHRVDGPMLLDLFRHPGDAGLAELGITSLLHVSRIRSRLMFVKNALLGEGASSGNGLHPCANGAVPRRMEGPSPSLPPPLPKKYANRDYVGCCGFPCRRGEHGGKSPASDDSDNEALDDDNPDDAATPPATSLKPGDALPAQCLGVASL